MAACGTLDALRPVHLASNNDSMHGDDNVFNTLHLPRLLPHCSQAMLLLFSVSDILNSYYQLINMIHPQLVYQIYLTNRAAEAQMAPIM